MSAAMRERLKKYTEALQKIYGSHLKSVILYGSYARGAFKKDSDIDIKPSPKSAVQSALFRYNESWLVSIGLYKEGK